MRKEKSSRHVKGLPTSLVNSTTNYTTTMNKKNLNKKIGESENESSIDVHNNNTNEMTRIPEITTEDLRSAINKLRKGKSPDSYGIRAEGIKACDDETREQIFNEIINQNEIHAGSMEESENKSDTQKKEMWKMLETTARSARCPNCSRQYCTADEIHDLTKNMRKIRQDSHTRHLTTLRRTE